MTSAADELVDVVVDDGTPAGRVVGTADRASVRRRNLWHRSVFVVVHDARARLVVHRRADDKDVWPGRWDVAFGGVVGRGEAFEAAARRELREESGLRAEALTLLGYGRYEDRTVRELAAVYGATATGEVVPADGEVVEVARVERADLQPWLASHLLVPDSVTLVVPYLLADRPPDHASAPDPR